MSVLLKPKDRQGKIVSFLTSLLCVDRVELACSFFGIWYIFFVLVHNRNVSTIAVKLYLVYLHSPVTHAWLSEIRRKRDGSLPSYFCCNLWKKNSSAWQPKNHIQWHGMRTENWFQLRTSSIWLAPSTTFAFMHNDFLIDSLLPHALQNNDVMVLREAVGVNNTGVEWQIMPSQKTKSVA